VGHNASKLPLTAGAIFLKGKRPRYLCEQLLVEAGVDVDGGVSSGALLGEFANLKVWGCYNKVRQCVTSKAKHGPITGSERLDPSL
jgi:hypothetical protein